MTLQHQREEDQKSRLENKTVEWEKQVEVNQQMKADHEKSLHMVFTS